jgi:molybdate transport system substrate-binding protein
MQSKSIGAAVAAVIAILVMTLGFGSLPSRQATAQTTTLHVLASDGIKPTVLALLPKIEHATGQHVTTEFNASKALEQEIQSGAAFDVAILTSSNIDELIQQGKITPDSRVDIARAGIGVGVRAGSPKPDVSTPEALKKTLLSAKFITFNPSGASATYFNQIVEQMGIAEKVKPKFIPDAAPGHPQVLVAEGKADIVITLIPEILDSKGVELAGPLPEKLQTYFKFSAGVGVNSHNRKASKALIDYIAGPAAAATIKAVGMEPR